MSRQSEKTAAKNRAGLALREQLIEEVGHCELCGHGPSGHHRGEYIMWAMELHHLIRGLRPNERYAVLLLCWSCHHLRIHGNEDWPDARQLAALKASRPRDDNLAEYNKLKGRGPKRITEQDVDDWEILE